MNLANKFNRERVFNIDTKDFKYIRLCDLYLEQKDKTAPIQIDGIFFSDSNFGTAPVFINKKHKLLINVPGHAMGVCKEIVADPDAVSVILSGKFGFTMRTYTSHNKQCYGVVFVDL